VLRHAPRALALAAAACMASGANAALTENLAVSPVAMSMGNAVTADPPGIDSIHFNPAGLARIKRDTRSDTLFAASLRVTARFDAPDTYDVGGFHANEDPVVGRTSEHNRQALYLPIVGKASPRLPVAGAAGLGLAWHPEDSKWTFATATYVPQAVGIDRTKDPEDPARYDGRKVIIQRLVYLSPSFGYKATDTLSFGMAVPIAHQGFYLDTDMRFPNELIGIIGKLQDGWCGQNGNPLDKLGFGLCGTNGSNGRLRPFATAGNMMFNLTAPADMTLNVGGLWEPLPQFAMGVNYQSPSKTVLTGRYQFHAEPMFRDFVAGMYSSLLGPIVAAMFGMPTDIPEYQSGNMTLVLPNPAHYQVGFKMRPIDLVQLNVDASYTDWGKWDKLTLQFDQDVKLLETARLFGLQDPSKLVLPRGYKSVWTYSAGMQLAVMEGVKLRFGYEPRKSSVPADKIDLIAPMPELVIKSAGLNLDMGDGAKLDIGGSVAKGHFNVPANTSTNLNSSEFFNVIYNPYGGLDVSGTIVLRYFGMKYSRPF
jgi:long-subunit fatty acid transport protein